MKYLALAQKSVFKCFTRGALCRVQCHTLKLILLFLLHVLNHEQKQNSPSMSSFLNSVLDFLLRNISEIKAYKESNITL